MRENLSQPFEPASGSATGTHYYLLFLLVLIGFFCGFFSVPVYTGVQTASSDSFRAQAVAANNIINGLFMVIGAIVSMVILFATDSLGLLFLLLALGNLGMIYCLTRLSPDLLGLQHDET